MVDFNYALSSLGAVATAHTTQAGFPPTLAIDGSDKTYYRPGAYDDVGYWKVDLGAPQYITHVRILPHIGSGTYTLTLQWSTDNASWNTLLTPVPWTADVDVPAGGVTARYWRFTVSGIAAGEWWGLYACECWGPVEAPPPPVNPAPTYIEDWLDGIEANYVPTITDWLAANP
jgi:hypothetical protein